MCQIAWNSMIKQNITGGSWGTWCCRRTCTSRSSSSTSTRTSLRSSSGSRRRLVGIGAAGLGKTIKRWGGTIVNRSHIIAEFLIRIRNDSGARKTCIGTWTTVAASMTFYTTLWRDFVIACWAWFWDNQSCVRVIFHGHYLISERICIQLGSFLNSACGSTIFTIHQLSSCFSIVVFFDCFPHFVKLSQTTASHVESHVDQNG